MNESILKIKNVRLSCGNIYRSFTTLSYDIFVVYESKNYNILFYSLTDFRDLYSNHNITSHII